MNLNDLIDELQDEEETAKNRATSFNEGRTARTNGIPRSENPHLRVFSERTVHSDAFSGDWYLGWDTEDRNIAEAAAKTDERKAA